MNKKLVHPRIVEIAKDFWQSSGLSLNFPLDIERAISRTQPLFIVNIPQLSISKVEKYLFENELTLSPNSHIEDRVLHGFIAVQDGYGYIFINGSDTFQERQFTLAHELAHFLLDYAIPRQKAVEIYGEKIKEALDGHREFTVEERLQSVIVNLSLKHYIHFIDNSEISGLERIAVWQAEERADQLALELLSPLHKVLEDLISNVIKKNFIFYKDTLFTLLTEKYNLPVPVARPYSRYLAKNLSDDSSIAEELGINF